jgi:acetyltransferase-like isoleucine patch superfamily enzyme
VSAPTTLGALLVLEVGTDRALALSVVEGLAESLPVSARPVASVVLVDDTGDPEVAQLLTSVEGGGVLSTGGGAGTGRAILAGLVHVQGDHVVLCGSEGMRRGALRELLATPDDGTVVVPGPGGCALVPRGQLEQVAVATTSGTVAQLLDSLAALGTARAVKPELESGPVWQPTVRLVTPGALTVGPHSYADGSVLVTTLTDDGRIDIGGYCSIAQQVHIVHPGAEGHPTHLASTFPMDLLLPSAGLESSRAPGRKGGPLTIGNDVWIGWRATILGGVTIGDGAVVATGAVVLGDVPPYRIVAGNPAKVVRSRFSPAIVERLLRIRWWEWPEDVVAERIAWFRRPITEFVEEFDPA